MQLSFKTLKASQAGDTIVEVMIAMSVLSIALVGTVRIINSDILSIQDHREHAQAIQLVQSQIEDLRAFSGSPPDCFNETGGNLTAIYSVASNQCILQVNGSVAPANVQPAYTIQITPPSSVNNNVFMVQATWDSVLGGQNQVSMEYRTQ